MTLQIETSPKRVRAYLGGTPIVDTIQARLVWESPHDIDVDGVRLPRPITEFSRR